MSKEWRIVQLSPLLTFEKQSRWIVSRKKLSDLEVETMQLTRFRYNFENELGLSGDGSLIIGVVTIPGATKEEVETECMRLNNGKKLFEELFCLEEDNNG